MIENLFYGCNWWYIYFSGLHMSESNWSGVDYSILFLIIRSNTANENHVKEALNLFRISTLDAARSGINQHINPTQEMAQEIKVSIISFDFTVSYHWVANWSLFQILQQAETQIKRRMGIGSHLSERRLIDDLARMGINESVVRIKAFLH